MKIKSIVATNFKGKDTLEFKPKKTTYAIVGPNGAGKTTIQEVIRYALTGEMPTEPIKKGESEMCVDVLLSNGTDFSRQRNLTAGKVRLNGKNTTGKMLSEYLESISGVPLDGIKISSSADVLKNSKPEELSEFLMSYLPENFSLKHIKKYMGTVEEEVLDELVSRLPKGEKDINFEILQDVYSQVSDERKRVKKEWEERNARVNSFKAEKPKRNIEDVEKDFSDILRKEGELEGVVLANKAYDSAILAKRKQEESIKKLEEQISLITVTRPSTTEKAKLDNAKKALNDEINSLKVSVKTSDDNIEFFKSTLDNLNKSFCPLSERLICTTDKTELKDEFMEQIQSNEESVKSLKKLINKKTEELNDIINVKEKKYNEDVLAYNKKITLIAQLNARKKEVIVLPAKPKDVVAFDKETLKMKKSSLVEERKTINLWEQHEKDIAEAVVYAKTWRIMNTLVSLLRPNGPVMTGIVEYYCDTFETICNETIKSINSDYSVKFVADKGIKIECEMKPGAGYIPYECASSGERACVIFALTNLISHELTGLDIMLLDDLDKLDKDVFDALIKYVMKPSVQDEYDHIIICAVNHEDTIATLKAYPDIDLHIV